MKTIDVREKFPVGHPMSAVSAMLESGPPMPAAGAFELEPAVARGVAMLERSAPETVRNAREAGVSIEYLGVSPLFEDARFYEGEKTDWVMGPLDREQDTVVPRKEAQQLRRLVAGGVEFPLLFIAHEVEQTRTAQLREAAAGGQRTLSREHAEELAGPVPPPAESVELAERLARRTTAAVKAARRAAVLGGTAAVGVVTAPVAALAAVTGGLDPVVLGAVPALSERPGSPAAWYVLARWDW